VQGGSSKAGKSEEEKREVSSPDNQGGRGGKGLWVQYEYDR